MRPTSEVSFAFVSRELSEGVKGTFWFLTTGRDKAECHMGAPNHRASRGGVRLAAAEREGLF